MGNCAGQPERTKGVQTSTLSAVAKDGAEVTRKNQEVEREPQKRKEEAKVAESMAFLGRGSLETLAGQVVESCNTPEGWSHPWRFAKDTLVEREIRWTTNWVSSSQVTPNDGCGIYVRSFGVDSCGASCHDDHLRKTYLQTVEKKSKQSRAFPLLASEPSLALKSTISE